MAEVKRDVFETPTNAAEFDAKASEQESIRNKEDNEVGAPQLPVPKESGGHKAVVKRSVGRKFLDLFFDQDIEDLPDYVLRNYIAPGLKDLFYNVVVGTTGQAMYGNRRNDYRDPRDSADYYNSRYNGGRRDPRDDPRESDRHSYSGVGVNDYRDVLMNNRKDAEEVILDLKNILYRYGKVSVGDFYQSAGITSDESVVYNWGWTDLDGIDCRPVQGGWRIILPRIKRL